MYTLGLDISTSVIGIAILDMTGKIVKLEFLNFHNVETLFEKIKLFKEKMINIVQKYPISKIAVEEALQGYGGGSSVQIRTMLSEFNAICRYVICEQFENSIPITLLNRQSIIAFIRKHMGWTIKGKMQKKQLVKHFYKRKLYDFPLKPRAKTPIKESEDMVDAWAAALCLVMQ